MGMTAIDGIDIEHWGRREHHHVEGIAPQCSREDHWRLMAMLSEANAAQQPFFLDLQARFERTTGGQRLVKGFSVGTA
jgi:sugar/nucleoside kinase (ribokinase family)